MHARLSPSRESFRELAHRGNLIPVYREIIADMETPVSAFHKIDTGDHSFLFESVEKGNKFARYSFLGASPHLIFQAYGKNITLAKARSRRHYAIEDDPLHELERLMAGYRPVPVDDLPLFYGGAVGYSDSRRSRNSNPRSRARKRTISSSPTLISSSPTRSSFSITSSAASKSSPTRMCSDPAHADRAYDEAVAKIEELEARLRAPCPDAFSPSSATSSRSNRPST